MMRFVGLLGLLVFIGICYAMSTNRKAIKWKPVIGGCVLQFVFALIILKTEFGERFFEGARATVDAILGFSIEGSKFIFGPLVDFGVTSKAFGAQYAFIFGFQIPGTIILVSALMAVLYYLGIMQKVVEAFAWIMQRVMGTSGSESLASAANIFSGQTEAPLVVRPYLEGMTKSEVMAMMTGGMATVAGGVLAAYAGMGVDAGHLLAASVMSAPATLAIAKLMVPETEQSETEGTVKIQLENKDANVIDAACRGAHEGLYLSLNVMGMLIGFIALIALINGGLGFFSGLIGEWFNLQWLVESPITLEMILGYVFAPFAMLMGVPFEESAMVGQFLGTKTIVNEFVAYIDLTQAKNMLSERSFVIATYALCGFANFSSIAVQVGGIGALVPSRRKDFAKLGFRAMIGGTIASFMTATIAGVLL